MRLFPLLFGAIVALLSCARDVPQHGLQNLSWGVPVALSTGGGRDCDRFVFADTTPTDGPECGSALRREDAETTQRLTALAVSLSEGAAPEGTAVQHAPVDLEVVHTRALIDLWYGVRDDAVLSRAITALRAASYDPGADAAVWSDLSAALLLRYRRGGDGLDLLTALDAAERALIADPASAAAAWNSALASTWIGLRRTQESAWARYEKVSGRRRPAIDTGHDDFMRSAAENARSGRWFDHAREHAWRTVAPAWGRAHLAGDRRAAEEALAELDTIARASSDPDRHHSPRAVLQVLRQTADTVARRELAEGFVAYAEYWTAFYLNDYVTADSARLRMKASRAFVSSFPAWVWYLEPLLLTQRGAPVEARHLLDTEGHRFATDEYPWVKRRVAWLHALVKLVTREHAGARDAFIDLERECLAARDEECAVAAPAMRAGAENTLGDHRTAAMTAFSATQRAVHQPPTSRSWTAVSQLRRSAELHHLPSAASAMSEDLELLAEVLQRPNLRIDGAVRRAQEAILRVQYAPPAARAMALELAAAAADHAVKLVKAAPPSMAAFYSNREYIIQADLAMLQRTPDARKLLSQLDTALVMEQRMPNANRLLPIRQLHGRARLLVGDTAGALLELDSVLTEYRARGPRDITVFEETRLVAMMSSARQHLARALLQQRRSTATLAVLSGLALADSARYIVRSAGRYPETPRKVTSVAVRQLGDSILLFIRDSLPPYGLQVAVSPVSTTTLQSLIDRTDPQALSTMYQALITPWRKREKISLPSSSALPHLALDVQGLATRVPWPALHDAPQGSDEPRYLIDDFEITLTSVQSESEASPPRQNPLRTLVIDAAPRKGATRLPGAVQEVTALQRVWGRSARVITTTTPGIDLEKAMQSADIVHFAGHAIIDDIVPERSALRIPTSRGDSLLHASTLGTYRLPAVRLVVLAACDTRVAGVTPSSGLESLAGVLHRAGVDNVIAAGWPVDDDATALLMQRLHEGLRSGLSPVSALRRAQLALRMDPNPSRHAPSVWAAFQLLGRGE